MKRKIFSILVALAVLLSLSLVRAVPTQAATPADIENSIVTGLAWLASVQQPGGSWQFSQGSDNPQLDVGTTGLAVLKFEDRAKNLGLDPFDTVNYQYANNVTNGLNYIFSNAVQDANGVHFPFQYDVYDTGIAMMAVSASNHPGSVVAGGLLAGMTYLQVVQGMMDWMAFAQSVGAGIYTGGWSYYPGYQPWADQSVSGYATVGIGFAHATAGFGVSIPASVPTGLTIWINNVQINGGQYDGGSFYDPGGAQWVNTLKTGNLLYELALTNAPYSDPRVTRAINFISTYWGNPGEEETDGAGWLGDYQAMFCMMKGLQAYGITAIPGHPDWFDEVSTYIVDNQVGGYWNSTAGEVKGRATISTAFALLTLEKVVPPPMPKLDHFKCYQVEGDQSLGETVELQDQFVTINATVQDPKFFCNPVEKVCGNVTTPIANPELHLTLHNITAPEVIQQWSVEVDNQFGRQVLNVSDPVMLAVPTLKGPFSVPPHLPVVGLDHFLLYKATGPVLNVTVNLTDQWHVEPEVVVLAPVYFANPVQKTHNGVVTGINNTDAHLVFYEIVGEPFNTAVVISNQFVSNCTLNVTEPYLLAVPSEEIGVTPLVLDHFKCYQVAGGQSVGETVKLQDQFVTINAATVQDAKFFCNPAQKIYCGKTVAPISHPDWHLTLYNITHPGVMAYWRSVNVSNQFGQQTLTVSNPVLLAVPTQKVWWPACDPPVGLDHFLLYKATGPVLNVTVNLADQWHVEPEVVVLAPVYFANPVQKTHNGVVTGINNTDAHLVFYKIVGEPFNTAVVVNNQFVSNCTLNVTEPYLLAVPSEMTGSVVVIPHLCFIATAAYGTPMAEQVQILREFRDEYLLTNPVGRALVDVYYRVSPPIAEFITEHPSLKPIVRAGLVPAVAMSYVVVNTTRAEKAAIIGLVVLVSAALAVWATRRRSRGSEYG